MVWTAKRFSLATWREANFSYHLRAKYSGERGSELQTYFCRYKVFWNIDLQAKYSILMVYTLGLASELSAHDAHR
jgi:hypothetical protein